MAQKKKKIISSRPATPARAQTVSTGDCAAAAAAIMLLCAVAGFFLIRAFAYSESDEAAFSKVFGGGTAISISAMLAAAAFWKGLIGTLFGAVGGFFVSREIPRIQLARCNFIGKIVLIVVPVLILYSPTMNAGFIWDDDQEITANSSLRTWSGLLEIWGGTKSADYFPLKTTMLWLEFQIWGSNAGAYHTVNFILHAIGSVMVWLVLRRMKVPGAWLAGLVFAVYPVHVESVAWIAERKNTLSILFYLLSILAWLNYDERRKWKDYVMALVWFLAGMLCKTHLVVLPVVLLLISWWQNRLNGIFVDPVEDETERRSMRNTNAVIGVIGIAGSIIAFIYLCWMTHAWHLNPNDEYIKSTNMMKTGSIAPEFWILSVVCLASGIFGLCERFYGEHLNQVLVRSIAFFQIAVLLGALTVWFQYGRAIGDERIPIGGMPTRIANAGKASWWYLTKAISPVNPWYEMPGRQLEPEMTAMAIADGKVPPTAAPSWPKGEFRTWPLITIYPRWRITPALWYDFLPALAMAAFVGLLWFKRNRWGRTPFFVLVYFLVTLLPVIGFLKMSYMRLTLVADHFQYLSDISIIAFACAAGTLAWRKVSPALKPLILAAGVLLVGAFTLYSWDRVQIYQSEYTLWGDVLQTADRLHIDASWQAHNHMGAVLFMQHRVPEATVHFAESCRLKPENPESHNNLGLGYVSQGRMEDGIAEYRRAIQIRNWEPSMHTNLGNALGQVNKFDEAMEEYRKAIKLNPMDPAAHCNLGYVLLRTGHVDEAIEQLQNALQIDPNMEQAQQNLRAALQMKNGGTAR